MPTSVANHYRPQTMAAGVGCRPPRRHANAGRLQSVKWVQRSVMRVWWQWPLLINFATSYNNVKDIYIKLWRISN